MTTPRCITSTTLSVFLLWAPFHISTGIQIDEPDPCPTPPPYGVARGQGPDRPKDMKDPSTRG